MNHQRLNAFVIGILSIFLLQTCGDPSDRSMKADLDTLNVYRERIMKAENDSNLDAMVPLFAEDIIIMAPGFPAVKGADAAAEFMRGFFDAYDVRIRYDSEEIVVSGMWAFDRGIATQTLTPRAGGNPVSEEGKYVWLYERGDDGTWKTARVIWNGTGVLDADALRD